MNKENENGVIEVLGALSDKTRFNIIKELLDGEKPCSELITKSGLNKSTFSHHAKILARCGLIKFRRDGKFLYFSLDMKYLDSTLRSMLNDGN